LNTYIDSRKLAKYYVFPTLLHEGAFIVPYSVKPRGYFNGTLNKHDTCDSPSCDIMLSLITYCLCSTYYIYSSRCVLYETDHINTSNILAHTHVFEWITRTIYGQSRIGRLVNTYTVLT